MSTPICVQQVNKVSGRFLDATLRTLRKRFPESRFDGTCLHFDKPFRAELRLKSDSVEGFLWPDAGRSQADTERRFRDLLSKEFGYEFRDYPYKVFGIGFPRTGTTSLWMALRTLGLFSLHYAPWMVEDIAAGRYRCETVDDYSALTDSPFPMIYKELDAAYPESRFVLTKRQVDDWLPSIEFLRGDGLLEYRRMYYGIDGFDERVYRDRYSRHLNGVQQHFDSRPGDLLVLDLSREVAWEPLCRFLDISEVPIEVFPWTNRRMQRS